MQYYATSNLSNLYVNLFCFVQLFCINQCYSLRNCGQQDRKNCVNHGAALLADELIVIKNCLAPGNHQPRALASTPMPALLPLCMTSWNCPMHRCPQLEHNHSVVRCIILFICSDGHSDTPAFHAIVGLQNGWGTIPYKSTADVLSDIRRVLLQWQQHGSDACRQEIARI